MRCTTPGPQREFGGPGCLPMRGLSVLKQMSAVVVKVKGYKSMRLTTRQTKRAQRKKETKQNHEANLGKLRQKPTKTSEHISPALPILTLWPRMLRIGARLPLWGHPPSESAGWRHHPRRGHTGKRLTFPK